MVPFKAAVAVLAFGVLLLIIKYLWNCIGKYVWNCMGWTRRH